MDHIDISSIIQKKIESVVSSDETRKNLKTKKSWGRSAYSLILLAERRLKVLLGEYKVRWNRIANIDLVYPSTVFHKLMDPM